MIRKILERNGIDIEEINEKTCSNVNLDTNHKDILLREQARNYFDEKKNYDPNKFDTEADKLLKLKLNYVLIRVRHLVEDFRKKENIEQIICDFGKEKILIEGNCLFHIISRHVIKNLYAKLKVITGKSQLSLRDLDEGIIPEIIGSINLINRSYENLRINEDFGLFYKRSLHLSSEVYVIYVGKRKISDGGPVWEVKNFYPVEDARQLEKLNDKTKYQVEKLSPVFFFYKKINKS